MTLAGLNRLAKDTGCGLHSDCLTCPLPECIYVTGKVSVKAEQRRMTIRQMAKRMGEQEIAEELGVCVRTVQRALKEQ